MSTLLTGKKQPIPAAITPNATLAAGQKTALLALQTARAAFSNNGVAVYIGEVNDLLIAVDGCLALMV